MFKNLDPRNIKAAMISCVFAGVGQISKGHNRKGACFYICVLLSLLLFPLNPMNFVTVFMIYLLSIYDALTSPFREDGKTK